MNEVHEWLRSHAREVALAVGVLLILSVVVGIGLGRAHRKFAAPRAQSERAAGGRSVSAGSSAGSTAEPGLSDLPAMIVPPLEDESPAYSFAFDDPEDLLDGIELRPYKISELLGRVREDMEPDLAPFVFNNEEFDVLMMSDGPVEP